VTAGAAAAAAAQVSPTSKLVGATTTYKGNDYTADVRLANGPLVRDGSRVLSPCHCHSHTPVAGPAALCRDAGGSVVSAAHQRQLERRR
jgi:hypothetical protein